MGFLLQMLFTVAAVIAVVFALWFSLWIFAILFMVGAGAIGFYALRSFLLEKDILNPTPGVRIEEPSTDGPLIEGDFERLGSEEKIPE